MICELKLRTHAAKGLLQRVATAMAKSTNAVFTFGSNAGKLANSNAGKLAKDENPNHTENPAVMNFYKVGLTNLDGKPGKALAKIRQLTIDIEKVITLNNPDAICLCELGTFNTSLDDKFEELYMGGHVQFRNTQYMLLPIVAPLQARQGIF